MGREFLKRQIDKKDYEIVGGMDNRVDNVEPMLEGPYFYVKGVTIYCPFDKIFNTEGEPDENFNTFSLEKKQSYYNDIKTIVHYMNYFVVNFDKEQELIVSLYKLKGLIDSNIIYPYELFRQDIFKLVLTPTLIQNIWRFVEYNYYISLIDTKNADKYKNHEALQFTDYHGKVLHCMAMSSKILAPLISHYYRIEGDDDKITKILKDVFLDIPALFSTTFNTYNKLYIKTRSTILKDHTSDGGQWLKGRVDGIDAHLKIDEFTKKLFVETFVKAIFKKNILSFIHSMLRTWVETSRLKKYKFNNFIVSKTDGGNGEDLSSYDKLEINNVRVDESAKIVADIIVDELIGNLQKEYDMVIDEESDEYLFYRDNLVLENFQKTMLMLFYSKYTDPYYLTLGYNYDRIIKLIILMKYKLKIYKLYNLSVICTSMPDKLTTRTLNKKDANVVMKSNMMKDVLDLNYHVSKDIMSNSSSISVFINNIINNKYLIVDYDNLEYLGEEFLTSKELLASEVIQFLKII